MTFEMVVGMSEPATGPAPHGQSSTVVEGHFYDRPEGFVVAADCLGTTYPTVIGGHHVSVLIPRADQMGDDGMLPQLTAPVQYYSYEPRNAETSNAAAEGLSPWGMAISADKKGLVAALVLRVAFRFEVSGSEVVVAKTCLSIESDLGRWWKAVSVWLDTYSELDLLGYSGRRREVITSAVGMRAFTGEHHGAPAQRVLWWSDSGRRTIRVSAEAPAPDATVLERCFRLAAHNSVPPSPWSYLRQGRSWLKAGEARRAVIDACTAAEIALADQVRQLLADTDTKVVEQLLDRCKGIADVASLVRQNGGTTASRKAIEEQLAKIRNEAAHAGKEPDGATAARAVEVAQEVVERVWPLASLDQPVVPVSAAQ
ncbi:hypothetical protein ACFROC_10800 [Nocardia tengchongensis]|uniref:hypothetical protein n=1 Tax=Nocardia tengchongensis TaxID=2055889 RepID=UPI00367507FE